VTAQGTPREGGDPGSSLVGMGERGKSFSDVGGEHLGGLSATSFLPATGMGGFGLGREVMEGQSWRGGRMPAQGRWEPGG